MISKGCLLLFFLLSCFPPFDSRLFFFFQAFSLFLLPPNCSHFTHDYSFIKKIIHPLTFLCIEFTVKWGLYSFENHKKYSETHIWMTTDRNMAHLHIFIDLSFMLGLRRGEILLLLSTGDDILLSMLTLRWILKCIGADSFILLYTEGWMSLTYLC